jgi:hypothetical protein
VLCFCIEFIINYPLSITLYSFLLFVFYFLLDFGRSASGRSSSSYLFLLRRITLLPKVGVSAAKKGYSLLALTQYKIQRPIRFLKPYRSL